VLIDRLQHTTDEETYALRARAASRLRSLVKSIRIAGAGARAVFGFEKINEAFPLPGSDQSDCRYFEVRLKDSSMRVVKPELNDPLVARAQSASRGYVASGFDQ
jgi:hypothetical protein